MSKDTQVDPKLTAITLHYCREDEIARVVIDLGRLTDEERVSVFSHFCTTCGRQVPACKCTTRRVIR